MIEDAPSRDELRADWEDNPEPTCGGDGVLVKFLYLEADTNTSGD